MAGASRAIGRLTALRVSRIAEAGMHNDGGGLYLYVSDKGARSWIYRYMRNGRQHELGLGSAFLITLQGAREKAAECRLQRHAGKNPLAEKRAAKAAARLEEAKAKTFDECRDEFLTAHEAGWRNREKHGGLWRATLATYVTPVFGAVSVQGVDTDLVLKALKPIWETKPETASRVRSRVESILDWATAKGLRIGDNPARWRNHLDALLPAKGKVRRVKHFASMPYAELADFLIALRKEVGTPARALEFTIATAARTNETIGARWIEIDRAASLWVMPAERMKMRREHRVPLNAMALAALDAMASGKQNEFVFPGERAGRPISNMAMSMLLRRMEQKCTTHGFRATFKTWANECTDFPNEVVEAALAHLVGSDVERAYMRGDMIEKRRALMAAWNAFCDH